MNRIGTLVAFATCAITALSAGATVASAHPETQTPAAAPATGRVQGVAVRPGAGRAEVVISLEGARRVRDFTLTAPQRIVVDIDGASLAIPARRYDRTSRGGIVDVRWSQFDRNIVRVVLTLDRKRPYRMAYDSGSVTISIETDSAGAFAAWSAGATRTVATSDARGARTAPPVASKQEPGTETMVDPASTLTEESAPVAMVAQRAPTPERAAAAAATLTEAAPAAAPQGGARAAAAATSGTRAASERNETPAPEISTAEAIASTRRERQAMQQRVQQPRISVAWSNADIREVLAQFAAFSGRTIVVGRGVEATVTAEILDQPWDVAMAAILASQGLAATEDLSGIIVVDTYQNIAARRTTEPLTTRTIRLNYARAPHVAENLRQRLTRDCSRAQGSNLRQAPSAIGDITSPGAQVGLTNISSDPTCPVRGAVTADTLTNSISITDVPGAMSELTGYARSLDIRQPQVAIKAKIVLVDRTSLEALGLKYDIGTRDHFFNTLLPRIDSAGKPVDGAGRFLLGGNALAGIANATATVPNAALQLVYSAALGRFDFTTFLEALQETSLLDVQSEPSVVTLNNRTAELRAGVEVPIRVIEANAGGGDVGFPRATVQLRQTGIILNVTPQITANRQIIMRVVAENSDVDFRTGDVGAVFPTQRVENELLVADGETAVMGGLTQTRVNIVKSGIPILVDLPLIGRLFGVTNRQESKRDLLILITPHIVDEGQMMPDDGDAR